MSLVKDGLAKAWACHLTGTAGFNFFPHRHDGLTAPPFGVVVVKRLRPLVPDDDVHEAEMRIVVVSDVGDSTSGKHQERVGRAYAAIQGVPRKAIDEKNGVILYGFLIEDIEPASGQGADGKKVFSDVFMMKAGVGAS